MIRPIPIALITDIPRDYTLSPDAPARAALAERMGLPAIAALSCTFRLGRDRRNIPTAGGELTATLTQLDVTTLEPFESTLSESFALRFLPEESLPETLEPDDPVDDVGYRDGTIDLNEIMAEQLALALDPYPRRA